MSLGSPRAVSSAESAGTRSSWMKFRSWATWNNRMAMAGSGIGGDGLAARATVTDPGLRAVGDEIEFLAAPEVFLPRGFGPWHGSQAGAGDVDGVAGHQLAVQPAAG